MAEPAAAATTGGHHGATWTVLAPAVFVVLWSTGFVGARWVLPHAPPMTFVALRFGIAAVLLAAIAVVTRATWPARSAALHSAIVGVLLHAGYVGAVFVSIDHGLPAGLSALLVGLQPVLSACVVGPWLGERVTSLQWLGLVIGFGGVALVLQNRFAGDEITTSGLLFSLFALVSTTVGTLYQKRFGGLVDIRTGGAWQFGAAALVSLAFAVAFEQMHVDLTLQVVGALAWFVLVLSLGTVSLLMLLIRHGSIARTTSLFYLVPPITVLWAWLWFDERVGGVAFGGIALAALGVALVQRGARTTG